MGKLRVLVTEDNDSLRHLLVEQINEQQDMMIVGEACDGNEALQFLKTNPADIMLLDIVMPNLDGFGVLEALSRTKERPKIIMLSALVRDDFIQRCLAMGAQYFMTKPFYVMSVIDRIRLVAKGVTMPAKVEDILDAQHRNLLSLDEKLADLFLSMGIPAHIKGYNFLREAIKQTINVPQMVNSMTKMLYPTIASQFDTTASKVERAIRHAIDVAWARGHIEELNKVCGCQVAYAMVKPTNGEFIAMVADKMRFKLDVEFYIDKDE